MNRFPYNGFGRHLLLDRSAFTTSTDQGIGSAVYLFPIKSARSLALRGLTQKVRYLRRT